MREVHEELNCDELLWVEKIQFPIPGMQLPSNEPTLLDDDEGEVYLVKHSNEYLVYGMPTFFQIGLKLA